jgi:predicted DNA binding CopG/RHH family protein
MTKKVLKPIPHFKTEADEAEFWDTHDTTEYIDWSKATRGIMFPNLKFSTSTISLRMPQGMVSSLKKLANYQDVPYQSLMKVYLNDRINHELSLQR